MRLAYPSVAVDLQLGRVERQGTSEPLTAAEARLLGWLHRCAERWVPPSELLSHLWGYVDRPSPASLLATVAALQRKLGEDPQRPRILRARPGVGVRLQPPLHARGALDPPTFEDAFVGRAHELERLDHAVGAHGRVVVVGPTGAGKTRLLADWATSRQAAWLDGVPDDGGLRALGGRGVALAVVDSLGGSVDEALHAFTRVLPEAQVVVGSRRAPERARAGLLSLEAMSALDAGALLRARAGREVGPDLLSGVERLPRAVELVAGCLQSVSDEELAQRLVDRAPMPGLRPILATAWELLEPRLREGLRRLTVFAGPIPASAALAVAGLQGADLTTLRRRGWLSESSRAPRLRLPSAVGAWVREQAGPPDLDVRERHAAWHADRAARWRRSLQGPRAPFVLAELAATRAEVAQASRWALEQAHRGAVDLVLAWAEHDPAAARGLLDDLERLVRLPEARAEVALAQARAAQRAGDGAARARGVDRALTEAPEGSSVALSATLEAARLALADPLPAEASAELVRRVHHQLAAAASPGLRVAAHTTLGDLHERQGRLPEALGAYRSAMQEASAAGLVDRWAWSALQASEAQGATAGPGAARGLLDRVIAVAEGHDLPKAATLALLQRGRWHDRAGDRRSALADFARAEIGARRLGDLPLAAHAQFERGARLLEEDGHGAERVLRQCLTELEGLGESQGALRFLAQLALAQAALDRRRVGAALRLLDGLAQHPLVAQEPFATVLKLVRAVAWALDDRVAPALAAVREAEARFAQLADDRGQVAALSVAARLSGDRQDLARLQALPAGASPELPQLLRLLQGAVPQQTDWWLVRQLARVRAPISGEGTSSRRSPS